MTTLQIMGAPRVDKDVDGMPGCVPRFRLLVVDDDEMIRKLLVEHIRAFGGFDVDEAAGAFDALALMEGSVAYDGLLVDINMPGMDGIEFLSRIKERDRTTVAMVITGYPSYARILDAMRAGAMDFLAKPFNSDNLKLALERLVRERKILLENSLLTQELAGKKALEAVNERLKKKIHEQTILFTISEMLGKVRSTRELYSKVVTLAANLTDAGHAFFWVVDHEARRLVLMASEGMSVPDWEVGSITDDAMPAARVAREGIPMLFTRTCLPRTGGPVSPFAETALVPFRIREEIFGVLAVSRTENERILTDEVLFLLLILAERASLTVENLLLYESVSLNLHATLRALVRGLEAKDPYTKEHSLRVTRLAVAVAGHMSCDSDEIDSLRFAGHLHDIGKIGIRDQILLKPGRLTEEEYAIIKTHPVIGEEIVSNLGVLPRETACIRHHHERWDGKGYPDGLLKTEIPQLARILAVADTFDAITTNRPYRPCRPREEAVMEIRKNAGTQFDPHVVEAFLDTFYDDDDELGKAGKSTEP